MGSKRLPAFNYSNNDNREKKPNRKQILEKKKAIDDLIKAASADKHPLDSFPSFRHFHKNGLSVYLESGCGDKLSSPTKQYIMGLLKANMEGPYGSEWPTEEKVKRKEMVMPEARYIFVHEAPNASSDEILTMSERKETLTVCLENRGSMVGFVQYRFTLEEEIPVLYVYELQLEPHVQAKGLGKFLMQLIELIARKNRMGAVVLTVQKANLLAMDFYLNKLRYIISTISPSRVDPLIGDEKSYEILCKAFDCEAEAIFEDSKEKRLLKGNNPSYYHVVIPLSLDLMLERSTSDLLASEVSVAKFRQMKERMAEIMHMMQQLLGLEP